MRVALVTDGTYPYAAGGTSTWCHQLVTGLHRHTFHLTAFTATGPGGQPVFPVPANVAAIAGHQLAGRSPHRRGRARGPDRRAATLAAILLCRGLLESGDAAVATFADGLRRLTDEAAAGDPPLGGVPLTEVLLDAWQASRDAPGQPGGPHPPLPRMSLRDARTAAAQLEQATRALAVRLPVTDLTHAVNGGAPMLAALAAWWRTGTPFLLTEHAPHLPDWSTDGAAAPPSAVRAVLLRFHRALANLAYAEAGLIVPSSRFHQRWVLRHGAAAARTLVVPPAVDPLRFPPVVTEPERPTVVYHGQLEPAADLTTLIAAFRLVVGAQPDALLRIDASPPPGREGYARQCRELVQRLGLTGSVRLHGTLTGDRQAYAAGHVVAVPGVAESTTQTLLEAMACGRATVVADLGPMAETVGDTGAVVPPADPAALAVACLDLLGNPARRGELGAAARRRALAHFTTDRLVRVYGELYRDVAGPAPAAPRANELDVAVPGARLPAESPPGRPAGPVPGRSAPSTA